MSFFVSTYPTVTIGTIEKGYSFWMKNPYGDLITDAKIKQHYLSQWTQIQLTENAEDFWEKNIYTREFW